MRDNFVLLQCVFLLITAQLNNLVQVYKMCWFHRLRSLSYCNFVRKLAQEEQSFSLEAI